MKVATYDPRLLLGQVGYQMEFGWKRMAVISLATLIIALAVAMTVRVFLAAT